MPDDMTSILLRFHESRGTTLRLLKGLLDSIKNWRWMKRCRGIADAYLKSKHPDEAS